MSITDLTPRQLRQAADLQEKIQGLQDELKQLLGNEVPTVTQEAVVSPRLAKSKKGRKKFSAETRAKMAAAQQARWAAKKGVKVANPVAEAKATPAKAAELARAVRWDAHTDSVHDEPSWVLEVARRFPDLAVIQLPQVLSTYNVANASVSRHTTDTTDRYIDWGLRYLVAESSRVRGDYLCTSPVSAAVAAGSPSGVMRSMSAAFRNGRPGLPAVGFASMSAARVVLRRLQAAARR